jgi:hypothetical protein
MSVTGYYERQDDEGVFERLDRSGLWAGRPLAFVRDATAEELAAMDADDARSLEFAAVHAHRDALAAARAILLDYRFGAPGTPSFPEVLSPVQTAVLDYRDSGIRDPECDEHIMWINARVNEINAAALYGAGVLR